MDSHVLFEQLSGESCHTLSVGQIVAAKVFKVDYDRNEVLCRLESGVIGVIKNFRAQFNQIVRCRVISLDYEKFLVRLDASEEALEKDPLDQVQPSEPWDPDLDLSSLRQEVINQGSSKKTSRDRRSIKHPLFKNMTWKQAEDYLVDKELGDAVIRPSGQGYDHITISFRFAGGVVFHMDVHDVENTGVEREKVVRLGKKLVVGKPGFYFEDINEILARYVEPLAYHAQLVTESKKYFKGNKEEMGEALRKQKEMRSGIVPYLVCVSVDHPGYFVLGFMPNQRAKHEYFCVEPEGYRFRQMKFRKLDDLINEFKKNPTGKMSQPRSRTSTARPTSSTTGPGSYFDEQRSDTYGSSYKGAGGGGGGRGRDDRFGGSAARPSSSGGQQGGFPPDYSRPPSTNWGNDRNASNWGGRDR